MTTDGFKTLWAEFADYWPNAKQFKSTQTGNAWWLVLKAYSKSDVLSAAVKYLQMGNGHVPTIAEITALLPPIPEEKTPPKFTENGATKAGVSRTQYACRLVDRKMAEMGYPTLSEWMERGRPVGDWWKGRGRAQLQTPEWMVLLTTKQKEQLRKEVC